MFDPDLDDLDTTDLLSAAAEYAQDQEHAAVGLLRIALAFADRNAVIEGHEPLPGYERLKVYGGEGCPGVAEFAPIELGAVLGMSSGAASSFVGEALALRHRLPRVWAAVLGGAAASWKARSIARACLSLSVEAAAIVDRRVAGIVNTVTPGALKRIVTAAVWQADPEKAQADAEAAAKERGVHVTQSDPSDDHGTKRIWVRAATGDVIRFDATINDLARALKILGDTEPLNQRRAKAIGWIADPEAAHNLLEVARYLARTHTHQQQTQPAHPTPTTPAHPTPQPHPPNATNPTDGTGQTSGTDLANGTGPANCTDFADGTDLASSVGLPNGTDSADCTGQTSGTDLANCARLANGTDLASGTGLANGTGPASSTDFANGTDPARSAAPPHTTPPPDSDSPPHAVPPADAVGSTAHTSRQNTPKPGRNATPCGAAMSADQPARDDETAPDSDAVAYGANTCDNEPVWDHEPVCDDEPVWDDQPAWDDEGVADGDVRDETTAGDADDADDIEAVGDLGGGGDVEGYTRLALAGTLRARLAAIKQDAYSNGLGAGTGRRARHTLYVHLTDKTLATGTGVLRVEQLGPQLANQLSELLGHDQVIVKPVIDLHDQVSVHSYEIPDRIRERVRLRHPVDMFPYSGAEATVSMDQDHITPYDHTTPDNHASPHNHTTSHNHTSPHNHTTSHNHTSPHDRTTPRDRNNQDTTDTTRGTDTTRAADITDITDITDDAVGTESPNRGGSPGRAGRSRPPGREASPDRSGPPEKAGQTSGDNLIPQGRLHHRAKTFGGWRNRRLPNGTIEWTSPHGFRFHVDHTGTHPQPHRQTTSPKRQPRPGS
ncbi:DUF222 domain-containing protein [Kribbella sp. NPDC004536]|uniref:DUF222 domain-containing protein n=1 Tax=Kribbella sp. NPDC004536 TaxID=3364106 RepID=UPI00369AAD53